MYIKRTTDYLLILILMLLRKRQAERHVDALTEVKNYIAKKRKANKIVIRLQRAFTLSVYVILII